MLDRIAGVATPEATARARGRFGEGVRTLGRSGLTVSPIGFGGYRVHVTSTVQRQALEEALRGGVNLVDTSTTYTDGGSEALVGQVLRRMVEEEIIHREEIVVVTKAGYIQGQDLATMQAGDERPREVVEYLEHCWHCIEPDFLLGQIERSADRLGLQTIDVFLLHNPEYFLVERQNSTGSVSESDRETFYDRIRRAFALLEEAVGQRRIGWYGISSNALVEDPSDPSYVDMSRLLKIAEDVGGADHHFAVVQTPMNVYELTAALGPGDTAPASRSVLDVATEAGVGVLTNRPLSAFIRDGDRPRVIRLADAEDVEVLGAADPEPLLHRLEDLEQQWADGIGARVVVDDGPGGPLDGTQLFRWGTELRRASGQLDTLAHWNKLRHGLIEPFVTQTVSTITERLEGEAGNEFDAWWDAYEPALEAALDAIETGLARRRQAVADNLTNRLDRVLPEAWRGRPLSHKAVLPLLTTQVSSVLVGMRCPAYVHDMLDLKSALGSALPAGSILQDVGRVLRP